MTRKTILEAFRKQGVHAYQAELAAEFLADGAAPHHLLVTPAGLGKVLIAGRIVEFMVQAGQTRRVLVIAPSAFCMLWRSRLEQFVSTIPVKLMYGRAFHEGMDETFLTGPVVAIVPSDTAVRGDVQAALGGSPWDMVIVAEVQSQARCQPLDFYRQILGEGKIGRSLLIAAAPLKSHTAGLPEFQVTDWSGDLTDWEGNTIELPSIRWGILDYIRSDEEVRFLNLLQNELEQSQASESPFYFETELLYRRAASSPSAARRTLEIMGRKLSRSSLHEPAIVSERQHGDPTEVEDVAKLSFTPQARRSYLEFVQEAFEAFQQIETDTKLQCLLGLLDELSDGRPGGICVLCAYAETVSYLHRALAEIGRFSIAINGGLSYSDRQLAMKDFATAGGILLATPGALGEESDLNRVKHVVHYDLPGSRSQMTALEGRFGRINRTSACRMYLLQDISGAIPEAVWAEQFLAEGCLSQSAM
ncbi:MAG: helicase-related protein [Thermoguttaceae bacterium]